jgi:anti-sigma factor (TIGR02949 family)
MSVVFTEWLKARFFKGGKLLKDDYCNQKDICAEILQLMLDGEASSEQEEYFTTHIEECNHCLKAYELEKAIRQLVKTKVKRELVPQDLISDIRFKISH